MKKLIFPVLSVLLFLSCIQGANKELLVGDWRGTEWLVDGAPSDYDAKQVHFHFGADGGYSSEFGADKDKGTYIVRGDELYTTAENQLEIMVKINKLTKDSLVFDMNRSGHSEKLTLLKSEK